MIVSPCQAHCPVDSTPQFWKIISGTLVRLQGDGSFQNWHLKALAYSIGIATERVRDTTTSTIRSHGEEVAF